MSIQSTNCNSIFSNIPPIPMPSTSENFKSQCASYINKAAEAFEATKDSDYLELIKLLNSVESLNTIDPSTFFKSKDVEPLISKLSEWEAQEIKSTLESPSFTLRHEDLQTKNRAIEILSTTDSSSDESEISSDDDRPSSIVGQDARALGSSDESDVSDSDDEQPVPPYIITPNDYLRM